MIDSERTDLYLRRSEELSVVALARLALLKFFSKPCSSLQTQPWRAENHAPRGGTVDIGRRKIANLMSMKIEPLEVCENATVLRNKQRLENYGKTVSLS